MNKEVFFFPLTLPLVSETEVDKRQLIFSKWPGHQPVPRRTREKQIVVPSAWVSGYLESRHVELLECFSHSNPRASSLRYSAYVSKDRAE